MIPRPELAALGASCLLAVAAPRSAWSQPLLTPGGTVAAAMQEGKVVVYGATDASVVAPLFADFAAAYPGISLQYRELESIQIFDRFIAEEAAGERMADVLWSSAMDLQMKLANDGHAMAYESPESGSLPAWAVWRNESFGTTLEPILFIYNTERLAPAELPQSHADLVKLLVTQSERFGGQVATYDPERSALGFLLLTQDDRIDPGFAEAIRVYRNAGVRLYGTTSAMIERVVSGEHLVAINVNGSYALRTVRSKPSLGIIYPRDYVLAISRIALIAREAPHPNAAKVFLDYLLSARGQSVLANQCGLFSIRKDVAGEATAAQLERTLGARLKPVHVGPSLLVGLDQAKRATFLRRWREACAPGSP